MTPKPLLSRIPLGCILIIGVLAPGIVSVNSSSQAALSSPTWHHVPPRGYPEARGLAKMVWDEARNEIVMFGGSGFNWFHNETWVWNGAQWTQKHPATSPPARRYFDMTYDPIRQEVVLFGGEGANNVYLDDTWIWNGASWTRRSPATQPSRRSRHAMAWDPISGEILLFGGIAPASPSLTGYSTSAETWSWNGTDWRLLTTPINPGPRNDHSMVLDSTRNEIVLFGGSSSYASIAGPTVNGTWIWNGSLWTEHHPDACYTPVQSTAFENPPCNAPSERGSFSMAYDAARDRVLLFGGGGGFHKGDTWTWDGLLWTKLQPQTSPRVRYGGAIAYDPIRERVVMFGGHGTYGYKDDTWTWDGIDWKSPIQSPVPINRWDPAMAYDPVRKETVLFGGTINRTGSSRLNDTWTWDGIRWSKHETPISPSARTNAAMGFHPGTGKVVLFGGDDINATILDDTWTWDGASWQQLLPATIPNRRTSSRMALHETTGRLVMFGGWAGVQRIDDMWEWTGSNWVELIPYRGSDSGLSPSYRNGHAMAYDPFRELVIVHDGVGAPPDTWGWNGVSWTKLLTPQLPPDRDEATLSWGGDDTMVLFGGLDSTTATRDNTFLWNGSHWTEVFPAQHPNRRRKHRMVWDTERNNGVLFGGDWSLQLYNDTWVWSDAAPETQNLFPSAEIEVMEITGDTVRLGLDANDFDGSISSWEIDTNEDGVANYSGIGSPPPELAVPLTGESSGTRIFRLQVTDDFGDSRAAVAIVRTGSGVMSS